MIFRFRSAAALVTIALAGAVAGAANGVASPPPSPPPDTSTTVAPETSTTVASPPPSSAESPAPPSSAQPTTSSPSLIAESPSVAPATVPPVETTTPVGPLLGPSGEIPLEGITDADVARIADGSGISRDDARFLLFEGNRVLVDFRVANRNNPEFGAVRTVREGGLRFQLRVTVSGSSLPKALETQLGRPVEVVIGGHSDAQIAQDLATVQALIDNVARTVRPPRFEAGATFEEGVVTIRVHPDDAPLIAAQLLPPTIKVVEDPSLVVPEVTSYAGVGITPDGCTVGYAAKSGSQLGVVTAAHCADTGMSAYGYTLGAAQQESCYRDHQVHTTTAPNVWSGFYNFDGQWTSIYAKAGGWYEDQDFFRRGRWTIAEGQISNGMVLGASGSVECGDPYSFFGFRLFNDQGANPIGGDSGGPLLLAYAGYWFIGGTTVAGTDGVDSGRSAWIIVPTGWTPCTQQTPC